MVDSDVRQLIAEEQWDELIDNDQASFITLSSIAYVQVTRHIPLKCFVSLQLSKELRVGRVFKGWEEGAINFAPTYKYEIKSDRYVGETPREGEKRRSPAW